MHNAKQSNDKVKLTAKQKEVIEKLRKYPKDIIVDLSKESFLTGGHGVSFDRRSLNSLRKLNLVDRNQLTNLGKTIQL